MDHLSAENHKINVRKKNRVFGRHKATHLE
jgi:hypothetical protein